MTNKELQELLSKMPDHYEVTAKWVKEPDNPCPIIRVDWGADIYGLYKESIIEIVFE
jgi:hypothetical protein